MAYTLPNAISDVYADVVAEWGTPIVFNNISKQCISSALEGRKGQQLSGYLGANSGHVAMLAADYAAFTDLIEKQSVVMVGGREFIVEATTQAPNSPLVRLILGPSY